MGDAIETSAEALEAVAMPRKRDVGKDGKGHDAELPPKLKEGVDKKSPAQWAYERLIVYIQKFEETLDKDQEVAMGFTGGDAGVLKIEGMGYFDPDIVTFYGSDTGGGRNQLVQHVSQLSVMLRALPKEVDQADPNRIGFRLAQELEADVV